MPDVDSEKERGYLCTRCWVRFPESILYVVPTLGGRDFRCGDCIVPFAVVFRPGEYKEYERQQREAKKAAKAALPKGGKR